MMSVISGHEYVNNEQRNYTFRVYISIACMQINATITQSADNSDTTGSVIG